MITAGLAVHALVRQAAGIDLSVVEEGGASVEELFRMGTDRTALTAQRAFPLAEVHHWTTILADHEYGGGTVVNAEPAIQADF